jgi:putative membrane protein
LVTGVLPPHVTTLVLCIDRTNDIGRLSGLATPVSGWEAVRSLVTDVGLVDPEDSSVNCMLEALRVARDLRDGDEDAVVAVVSGAGDSMIGADRSVAAQVDDLIAEYEPDSAVVVIDSIQDEQVVPVVESRITVDSVDRVVVRQARDIESTYYLLKQFLADEELRSTLLVPLGIGLLAVPLLLHQFSVRVAFAGIAALLGAALLYKGLAVDELLATARTRARTALYSGQVSVVTYVAAGGLATVGVSLGALDATPYTHAAPVVPVTRFIYGSVPWLALAALTASAGRLLDEVIDDDGSPTPYFNLPFAVVAVGLVLRGFAGYFLEREGVLPHLSLAGVSFLPTHRLAAFIVAGVVVSVAGVRLAANVTDEAIEEVVE